MKKVSIDVDENNDISGDGLDESDYGIDSTAKDKKTYFASQQLSDQLWLKEMTFCGTLKKNKT